ncbi:hypothetical protein GCM10018771_67990 [Streptomyces cellulosae]|nr:hypothetical protein GCM10018771_67990 [Streptomyces cellulosae]
MPTPAYASTPGPATDMPAPRGHPDQQGRGRLLPRDRLRSAAISKGSSTDLVTPELLPPESAEGMDSETSRTARLV